MQSNAICYCCRVVWIEIEKMESRGYDYLALMCYEKLKMPSYFYVKRRNFLVRMSRYIPGALDFISTAGPALGVTFDRTTIPHHPFSLPIKDYVTYVDTLRMTSISDLKKLYPRDPGFCDNLALGQSVYRAIAGN
jgi:hypothetical protein